MNFLILLLSLTMVDSSQNRSLVTFNTGLTRKILGYAERKAALGEELKQIDADVICLQEMFYGDDTTKLIQQVHSVYPYSYSSIQPGSTNQEACSGIEFEAFLSCLLSTCSTFLQDQNKLLMCVTGHCGLMDLEQQCISCLVMTPVAEINVCTMSYMNYPGLLLLSKTPLIEPQIVHFLPNVVQLLPRSYLQAMIDGIGETLCTHLSSNLGLYIEPNLQGVYSSWEEQNKDEVQELADVVSWSEKAVIMGDLNCGPVIPDGGPGEFSGSYNYLVDNMTMVSPYVDLVGTCTWCKDHYLVPGNYSYILDHVFLKGISASASKRVFENTIPGQPYSLSDHYGVQVTVTHSNIL